MKMFKWLTNYKKQIIRNERKNNTGFISTLEPVYIDNNIDEIPIIIINSNKIKAESRKNKLNKI